MLRGCSIPRRLTKMRAMNGCRMTSFPLGAHRLRLLLFLSCIFPLCLRAQYEADAKKLLDALYEKYVTDKTYRVNFFV